RPSPSEFDAQAAAATVPANRIFPVEAARIPPRPAPSTLPEHEPRMSPRNRPPHAPSSASTQAASASRPSTSSTQKTEMSARPPQKQIPRNDAASIAQPAPRRESPTQSP